MSRRHHGARGHARPAGGRPAAERRTGASDERRAPAAAVPDPIADLAPEALPHETAPEPRADLVADAPPTVLAPIPESTHHAEAAAALRALEAAAPAPPTRAAAPPPPVPGPHENAVPAGNAGGDGGPGGCTAPQLRRFIKSRAYVPMHELRRRFGIEAHDDDVTPVDLEARRIFVGLPGREGRLLGELLRSGDIGYELSLDPITPVVVGVYPMRPVARP